jgi:hypothetical protein
MISLHRSLLLVIHLVAVAHGAIGRVGRSGETATTTTATVRGGTDVTTVCLYLANGRYETRRLNAKDAHAYMARGRAVDKACNCAGLCAGWSTFVKSGDKCICLDSDKAYTLWSTGQEKGKRSLQTGLLDPDFGDLSLCSDNDECDVENPCDSNQVCTERNSACTCVPVPCATPYGNPCGPDSACTDTYAGYTCTSLVLVGCPAGCGPNSKCDTTINECVCARGFHRPIPYLGCVSLQ